jgi:hypothetical protein
VVVVDDRGGLERILLVGLEGHPVGRVVGEEGEPLREPPVIEEPGLVIEESLELGGSGRAGR